MYLSFRVSFSKPEHGSMIVEVGCKEKNLFFVASYLPYCSIFDLVEGLIMFIKTSDTRIIKWNTEPVEYEFIFAKFENKTTFEVKRFPDSRRNEFEIDEVLFRKNGSDKSIVIPFWRALRRLETYSDFENNWRRVFPKREMELLNKYIRDLKKV